MGSGNRESRVWRYGVGKPSRTLTKCRVCGGKSLFEYLDLGSQPLANAFVGSHGLHDQSKSDKPLLDRTPLDALTDYFPLTVYFCDFCGLSQLSCVVDPGKMYLPDYAYASGVSESWRAHCIGLAKTLNMAVGQVFIDIGANDGTMLLAMREFGGCPTTLGVDPATNYSAKGPGWTGSLAVHEFWSSPVAKELSEAGMRADIILAQNVLAHVDDLDDFLHAVRIALKPKGRFIFEVPYLPKLIESTAYDTIYHEHLSYFLVGPLERILSRYGLFIESIEELPLHGGSIRVWCSTDACCACRPWVEDETDSGYYTYTPYSVFNQAVKDQKVRFLQLLESLGRMPAIGAAAKATVLANYCNLTTQQIEYIVDDTPAKQGRYQPGTHIPIVGPHYLLDRKPSNVVIFAWNWAQEIMRRYPGYTYVLPNPPRVVGVEMN